MPVLAGLVLVALAGCGGTDTSTSSAGSVAGGAPEAAVNQQDAAQQPASGQKAASAGLTAATQVRLVRTAELTVEVNALAAAAERVRATAKALGGLVSSEVTGLDQPAQLPSADGSQSTGSRSTGTTSTGGTGRTTAAAGQSVLVLRIPVNALDTAIARIETVGKPLSRSSSSQDVTADIADLDSRVKTATASVTRVRALLAGAKSLQDIVLLESELTRREADLEALQARQATLSDQADLSTLTVVLQTPAAVVDDQPDTGFLAGLTSGWSALTKSAVVALQVVGALVPWAVLAALVAWPVMVLVRRRRSARREQAPPAPSAAPPHPVMAGAGAPPAPLTPSGPPDAH